MLNDPHLAGKHEIVVPRAAAVHDDTAAEVLIKHLFAQPSDRIPGIDYAVGYKPAEGPTGGDILAGIPHMTALFESPPMIPAVFGALGKPGRRFGTK